MIIRTDGAGLSRLLLDLNPPMAWIDGQFSTVTVWPTSAGTFCVKLDRGQVRRLEGISLAEKYAPRRPDA